MKTSEKILAIHSENPMLTYRQIGKEVGVSNQRVHQVLKKKNIKRRSIHERRADVIRPLFMRNLSYEEISKITNFSHEQISFAICGDDEMKSSIVIYNQVFLFEIVKAVSKDWICGMPCEEICHKYNFAKKDQSKQIKSGIIHSLRLRYGIEMFPKRNGKGVENIVEVYDKLKAEGKTNKEIFQIVGGYKNAESMYSAVRGLRKK